MPLFWISLSFVTGLFLCSIKNISMPILIIGIFLSITYLLIQSLPNAWMKKVPGMRILRLEEKISLIPQTATDPRPVFPLQLLIPSMIITLCLGIFSYQGALPKETPQTLATYNDNQESMRMIGVIDTLPNHNPNSSTVFVSMEQLCEPQQSCIEVTGKAYIIVNYQMEFTYGDRIEIYGKMTSPTTYISFSEITYLKSKETFSKITFPSLTLVEHNQGNPIKTKLFEIREKGVELLFQLYPQPESSLLAGIVFGEESKIPQDIEAGFRNTNTAHIIVISGFNITILAALCLNFFKKFFSLWKSTLITLGLIIAYTIMVGGDAAVSRAAVMGCMGIFGLFLGRRQTGVNSLSFTAAFLCVFNPFLIHDIGFQLSFIATLGLILFSEPIGKALSNFLVREKTEHLSHWINPIIYDYLSPLLAAQLMVTPLMVYYFRQFSLSSVPANLAIAPLQPPIMIFGAASVAIGFVVFPLGKLISFIAWTFTALTVQIVMFFDGLPANTIHLSQIDFSTILLLYIIILGLSIALQSKKISLQKISPALFATGLAIFTLLTWQIANTSADGNLHVHFLNIDQGEAILIQTPHGNHMLINGGKNTVALSNAIYPNLPITKHTLDAILVASFGSNQISSLEKFANENPTPLLLWGNQKNSAKQEKILTAFAAQGSSIELIEENQVIQIDKDISITVLQQNETGLSLLLRYDQLSIFFCLEEEKDCLTLLDKYGYNPGVAYFNELSIFENFSTKNIQLTLVNQPPSSTQHANIVFLKAVPSLELVSDGMEMWFTYP